MFCTHTHCLLCLFDKLVCLVPVFHEFACWEVIETNVEVPELLRVEVINLPSNVEYVLHSIGTVQERTCINKKPVMLSMYFTL